MRINFKTVSAAAFAGLLLAGCASAVHVERDKSVNLKNYKTFAWVDTRESKTDATKTKVSDLTERIIKETVNDELSKAGWKQSKKPDVLLTYDVLVERGVKEESDPLYTYPTNRYYLNPYSGRLTTVYYPSYFMGYDRSQRPVREGTITVRLIDARTDKTIWEGWTTDEVNSRNLTSKEIRNGIKSIFRKFDVAKN